MNKKLVFYLLTVIQQKTLMGLSFDRLIQTVPDASE